MIFLIRHGQTEFNLQGRLQGQNDSPLTTLGEEQARRMAGRLKLHVGDGTGWRVISSHLGRTRRTAEIVCAELGLGCAIEEDPRICEVHVGEWEGWSREEIDAVAPGVVGTPGWLVRTPGGETYERVAARVRAWLDEHDRADGAMRLVVSHGITGRILRNLYRGDDPAAAWREEAPPQDAVFRLHRGTIERIDL